MRSSVSFASTVAPTAGASPSRSLQLVAASDDQTKRRCPPARCRLHRRRSSGRTTGVGGQDDADRRPAVGALLDREAAVQRRARARSIASSARRAPLARCRRRRRSSRSAARRLLDRDRDLRRRPAPDRLVERLADDLVERRPAPSRRAARAAATSTSICTRVLDPELLRERLHRRREALVAQHDRLEVEREVAQRADRLAVALERLARGSRCACSVRPSSIDVRRRRRASARSRRATAPARRGGRARAAAARPARP